MKTLMLLVGWLGLYAWTRNESAVYATLGACAFVLWMIWVSNHATAGE